jgi:hypothetical protein
MTGLVRVTRRRGRIDRVPRGQTPAIDLVLAANQTIVSIELVDQDAYSGDRKTVDWRWTAYIATRVGSPDA